jgi:hypothetical protein
MRRLTCSASGLGRMRWKSVRQGREFDDRGFRIYRGTVVVGEATPLWHDSEPPWRARNPGSNATFVKSVRPMRGPPYPAKTGRRRSALDLVAGWVALALYLLAYAPAGLGFAALVGAFDCNHQVRVRYGERGMALGLHHGRDCPGHRHGTIARTLTCFAQPSRVTDPDHVIQFAAADLLPPMAQPGPPSFQGPEHPAAAPTEVVFGMAAGTAPRLALPRSPPGECDPVVRCLHSTVLLI